VHLLNQQDVAGLRVGEQPKQFRPGQLGAGLVLDASTDEQDASRAKDQLKAFAAERGLQVACWYGQVLPCG
jgi:hypothetical protein